MTEDNNRADGIRINVESGEELPAEIAETLMALNDKEDAPESVKQITDTGILDDKQIEVTVFKLSPLR